MEFGEIISGKKISYGKISDEKTPSGRVQPDQINMAMFFWYLVKRDLSSVRSCTLVDWTCLF